MSLPKWVQVACPDCGENRVVNTRPSSTVKCKSCDTVLAEPNGGYSKPAGEIVKELA